MTGGEIAGITLGGIGIVAAIIGIIVAVAVYFRTEKILKRMRSIVTAFMPPSQYKTVLRLVDDIEKTGKKTGTVVQRQDKKWGIDWELQAEDGLKAGDKPSQS